jgi:hypothetical protein
MFAMWYADLDEYGKCIVFSTDVDFAFRHKNLWTQSKMHIINSKQVAKLTKDKEYWIVDGPTERFAPLKEYPYASVLFNEIVEEGKIK